MWLTRQEAAAMSEEDRLDYLTKTVLGEAVGEGLPGMLVVAQVIANRTMNAKDFSSDPVAVAGQKFQFSTNNPFAYGGNQQMVMGYGKNTKEYQEARAAVDAAIINKSVPDITGGSEYYHTTAMGWPSSWPSRIKQYGFVDIGGHRVYPNRPIKPGEIPANLARATEFGVASLLDVRQQGLAPIRPASLSANLRLQRETNRVAQARANAPTNIKRSRTLAFGSALDPFEIGRPANVDLVINRPIPAMKESMQRQLRATGTPATSERTFAMMNRDPGFDGDSVVRVSTARMKPAAVVEAPWGVRESVAASVAATEADNGRGQLVMTGNPNIAGSVVTWLYPQIAEGEGEANQEGKGPRAAGKPGQSTIERAPPPREAPGQSEIERSKPIVKVQPNGSVRVVPQSQIERADVVTTSIQRANAAGDTALATTLASQIATKRRAADVQAMRAAEQGASDKASRAVAPPSSPIERKPKAAPPSSPIERVPARVPGPNAPPKSQERLVTITGLEFLEPPKAPPARLPALLPPNTKADPIGAMPNFKDLALMPSDPLRPATLKAPKPADAATRERARDNPLFGQPGTPDKIAPVPAGPDERLAARTRVPAAAGPTTRPVTTTRVTTTAPVPAGASARDAARAKAAGKPGLRIVVQADQSNATASKPAAPAAAKPAPATSVVQQIKEERGVSSADAYDIANQEAKDRAIANAKPGYNDPNALWRR
jgi:hypothetical protein